MCGICDAEDEKKFDFLLKNETHGWQVKKEGGSESRRLKNALDTGVKKKRKWLTTNGHWKQKLKTETKVFETESQKKRRWNGWEICLKTQKRSKK